MAEITLYKDSNFEGRAVTLQTCGSYSLGNEYGFNDATSSIRVKSGIWLLYQNSGYDGTCWIVTPGEYANSGTWKGSNDSISSLRPLPGNAGDRFAILFEHVSFRGRMVSVSQSTSSFSPIDFNDKTSSAIILGGNWLAYRDSGFSDTSWPLSNTGGPDKNGRYPSYEGFFANDAISSIKPT